MKQPKLLVTELPQETAYEQLTEDIKSTNEGARRENL